MSYVLTVFLRKCCRNYNSGQDKCYCKKYWLSHFCHLDCCAVPGHLLWKRQLICKQLCFTFPLAAGNHITIIVTRVYIQSNFIIIWIRPYIWDNTNLTFIPKSCIIHVAHAIDVKNRGSSSIASFSLCILPRLHQRCTLTRNIHAEVSMPTVIHEYNEMKYGTHQV